MLRFSRFFFFFSPVIVNLCPFLVSDGHRCAEQKVKQTNWFRLQSSKHIGSRLQAASSELTRYPHLAPTRLPEHSSGPPSPSKHYSAVGRLCNGVANLSSPLAVHRLYCNWSTNGVRERHTAGLTQMRKCGLPTWFTYIMFKSYTDFDQTEQQKRIKQHPCGYI